MRNSSQGKTLPPFELPKIPVGEANEMFACALCWNLVASRGAICGDCHDSIGNRTGERKVCTYCGMDGHRASSCPRRPFQ